MKPSVLLSYLLDAGVNPALIAEIIRVSVSLNEPFAVEVSK